MSPYEIAFYNAERRKTFTLQEEILPVAIMRAFTELRKPGTLLALREVVAVYDFANGEKFYEETQLSRASLEIPQIEGVGLSVYMWRDQFKYALWEPRGSEARATLLKHYQEQGCPIDDYVSIGRVGAYVDYESCFCHHCKYQEFRLAYAGNQYTPPEYDSFCTVLKKKTEEGFCEGENFEEVKS